MRKALKLSQTAAATACGGWRTDTWSRIERGHSLAIPVDMLCGIADFAARSGISLAWLFAGHGHMLQGGMGPMGLDWLLQANRDELMCEFARLTLDTQTVTDLIKTDANPEARAALAALLTAAPDGEAAIPSAPVRRRAKRPAARPGYRTVPPEDVPTSHDWHTQYVPIVGRIAAGQGIDTTESTEYPPGWAAEFLVYDGAPEAAVAVRIKGESMSPRFGSGDMAVVDTAGEVGWGEVCCVLVRVDDIVEARLKRPVPDGGEVVLQSLNPDPQYAPERVGRDAVVRRLPIVAHLPLIVRD